MRTLKSCTQLRNKRISMVLAGALAVLFSSSACRHPEPKETVPSGSPLRIAYFLGGRTATIYRAWEEKRYSDEGINVELITKSLYDENHEADPSYKQISDVYNRKNSIEKTRFGKATGDELVDYMLEGKADGATIGEVAFIRAIAAGKPIVAVSELGFDSIENPGHAVVLRKGALEEYRRTGKKIRFATRTSSGGDLLFAEEFFRKQGIDPEKALDLVPDLSGDELRRALRKRKVEGAYLHMIALFKEVGKRRLKADYEIYPFNWVNPEMCQALLVFTKDYVAKHPDEIERLIRANLKQIAIDQKEIRRLNAIKPQVILRRPRGALLVPDFKEMDLPGVRATPTVRVELLNEVQKLLVAHRFAEKSVDLEPAIDNHFVLDAERPAYRNVIVIGWDGTQRDRMEELLNSGRLPNLKRLIDEGSFVKTEVVQGRTETKPGWSQIFTGYDTDLLGVKNNRVYRPIPPDDTVFERLKDRFGSGISIAFIAGKGNNLASRGPHYVCGNCYTRFPDTRAKTLWWFEGIGTPTFDGGPPKLEEREGEPYFNAVRKIDIYKIGLNQRKNVLPVVLNTLDQLREKRFFAFFHFEEPDEQGHVFGEGSREYSSAIEGNDAALGEILQRLKVDGLSDKTAILLTTDHGQDKNRNTHQHAPDTFLVSNLKGLRPEGDRRDVAPTILELYGFDLSKLNPPLSGHSLLEGNSK